MFMIFAVAGVVSVTAIYMNYHGSPVSPLFLHASYLAIVIDICGLLFWRPWKKTARK